MADTGREFDIHDYLRLELMPHFMCPGCGHGIALRALLWAVHELDIDKDRLAIVSGIGCSGRVAAYVDANTVHCTHGRPLAFATGLESQPDCPWLVVQGDQDELVDVEETVKWVDSLEPGPELLIVPGGEHFFHGRLTELRQAVMDFVAEES